MPGFGHGIGGEAAALRGSGGGDVVLQAQMPVAGGGDVPGRAIRLKSVPVEHRHGLRQRIEGVGGIVFRAQKALFLGGEGDEAHGPLRPRLGGEDPGQFQQGGDAAGIVHRAVVDAVTLRVRQADAQMVPVGGIEDVFVRMDPAGQQGHHIVRDDGARLHLEVGAEPLRPQGHRTEVGGLGPCLLRLEVEARAAEQVHRLVPLDPAFQQGMGLARGRSDHVELRGAVGILHRGPAIGGRGGLVHDQHAHGPLAGGFLVLVGPAAVIGHGLAVEPARGRVARRGLEVGVIDQDDGHLALQVHALEVVPVPLGGLDAIADEDQRGL